MSKGAVIDKVVGAGAASRAEAEREVDRVVEAIKSCLTNDGDKVVIRGFGTFTRKHRAERQGRNPRTGEPIRVAASSAITFKAAK